MAQLRLGFVGAGFMGQAAHLRNYATLPGCRIVALAEKRPKLAAEVARRYGIERVYADYPELLDKEGLDGIVAIQPFQLHSRYVPELLAKGVPVMTEKPLASTVDEGEAIVRAVERTGTLLFLAYHKRSDPAIEFAKQRISEWLDSGEVGSFKYVRITMPPGDWMGQASTSNVTTDESYDAGLTGGKWDEMTAFVNYYIHQVNLFRHLLGEDFEVLHADPSGVTITIRSASGVPGVLEMAPYETPKDWQESVLITFEKAWIRVDLPAPLAIDRAGTVTVYAHATGSRPTLPPWHAMRRQAAHFLAAIRGEDHPLCSAEDGLKDLRLAARYIQMLRTARITA